MKFRIDDVKATRNFASHGVPLSIHTYVVEGYTMHYAQTGSDTFPTLFFVHGSPGSWDVYSRYMQDKDLLARFRMISLDRPGFGFSSFGKARNLEEQSKLIAPLLEKIRNGKPIYAVGHSMGGPVVVRLALDHPGLFSGLVLLSAALSPYLEKPERWRPLLFKTPLNYLVPGALRPANQELWYLKNDLKQMEPELGTITAPVWILHGDKDPLVPVENVAFMKTHFVHSKKIDITIIAGANHFIPWQHYDEIKAVLMNKIPLSL
ncbi:MAG: alpha/beta hydrolase [Puia sp.]|nr:alpha/beta hydrolase [Puia sp.]